MRASWKSGLSSSALASATRRVVVVSEGELGDPHEVVEIGIGRMPADQLGEHLTRPRGVAALERGAHLLETVVQLDVRDLEARA